MGKRSNLYEIYFGPIGGFSAYDSLKNGPRGSEHSTGDPLTLAAEFEDETDIDDLEEDESVDVLSKTRQSMSVNKVDLGRKNPGSTSYDNIGYAYPMVAGLTEKTMRDNNAVTKHAKHLSDIRYAEKSQESAHTTTAVPGGIPNMTYRTSKGNKATKVAGNSTTYPKIYQRPRVDMTASRYGTARAQLPRHNELDDNIYSLDDLLDKHEVSLVKHTNNVNRLRSAINEINDNFYDI